MSFDIFGPTRHVRASTVDDGGDAPYDLLALPRALGLKCPQLERLHQRFYDTTQLEFAAGEVLALRDEVDQLQQTYRQHLEPQLMRVRGVRARDPAVRERILDRVLQNDPAYAALEELRQLCEEAVLAEADVRCFGD
jgi:hypothetical protein